MGYTPPEKILAKYAAVLVNFALNSGEGVKSGEVVRVSVPESAKLMYAPLRNALLKAGAFPMMELLAQDIAAADVFSLASDEQLTFFPKSYYRGIVEQIDHSIFIIAEQDKYELKGVDAKKIMLQSNALKPYREWRDAKEAAGKFTWTLGMYGTKAMADDVGMSEEEYWQQIIAACYLDQPDPIAEWRKTCKELARIQAALNQLNCEHLELKAEGINLKVGIGEGRRWLGGSGRNIPSFELFISPDYRQTEGEIFFNQPLYRYGNVIKDIYLRFKAGKVVECRAATNQAILEEMIATPGADQIGEFSLTDGRFSKITRVMGETLFDENIGGPQGNTHIALGNAYQDSYTGDASKVTQEEWQHLGYNQSAVHTDIISTAARCVTASMKDGTRQIIYDQGKFLV